MPDSAHAAAVNYVVPPGIGTYDDRYAEINYSGSWIEAGYSGPYASTITYSNMIGSTASFTFDGEGITLMYTAYSSRGEVDIYIDAGYVITLNQYSSSLNWQQEWTSGALGAGAHTISFEHMSGATVDIDALIVTGPPPPPTCWAFTMTHTGSGSDPVPVPTNSSGCSAGEYYVGETISLIGAFPDSGWVISSWTGTDNDASTTEDNVVTMPDNAHGAAVNYVEPPGTGTYDDRYAGINYSGSWSQASYSGPYAGTFTESNTVGDSGSFTFDGEGITLVYTGYLNRGTMDIYIDAGYVDTLNQYSSSLNWQQEWTSGSLGAGVHTITFEHMGGSVVDIDAFIVTGPPDCHALTLTHTGSGSDPTASPINSSGCPVGEYYVGETIFLSGASPDSGWTISGWTGTDTDASTGTTNIVTMPDAAHAAAVNYVEPPGVGTYDDRYVGISYSGSWSQASYSGPYAGTLTISSATETSGLFTFDGEGIKVVYTAYSDGGYLDVEIDGGVVTDSIDMYSPSLLWQQEWDSGPLSPGVHTIAFENDSGASVYVDAFIVSGSPPLPTCNLLTLSHNGAGSDPAASPTNSTGCSVGEYYAGETISLSGASPDPFWVISSWTGTDDDASTAATNVVTMPDSAHAAAVNYFVPPGTGTYDDRDAGINYSGSWSEASYSGPYLGTITQSSAIGSTVSFAFIGDSITIKYTGYTTRGTVNVYVDGSYVTTFDQSYPGLLWQVEYTIGSLGYDAHTITFEHATGATIGIDALIVP